MIGFIHKAPTKIFRPAFRPFSGWSSYTRMQKYKSLRTDQTILAPKILIIIHFSLYLYYLHNFKRNYNCNYYGVIVTRVTKFIFLYYFIRTSPWRWPECRSKHVGENCVNKIHHKYRSVFICFFLIYCECSLAVAHFEKVSQHLPGGTEKSGKS
jgi:hypothetical protein